MSSHDEDGSKQGPATRLVRTGRDPALTGPFVNPPVVHASTVLFPNVDMMAPGAQKYAYGRRGTPTSDGLETAISELENAEGTVLCPSGLSAVSTALLAILSAGDHLLMADNVYEPARHIAVTTLARLGIRTTFFDPTLGSEIASLMEPETKAVYVESPGSLTFEMTDIPAIAAAAHARGAYVLTDNTWATPYFFKPLDHGADISIQAGTKYLSGHSDVMIGTLAANDAVWKAVKNTHGNLGLCVGPDDIYLANRGLRTMGIRLDRQMQSALTVARWLEQRPEVKRLLHPAMPSDPGHAIWKRDMKGASGLFGIVMDGWSEDKTKAFLNGLGLFGLGYSWGGFESLAIPAKIHRTATSWEAGGPTIRLHVGLEEPADLIADLEQSFARIGNLA
ncbi:cystathionine beta-lyase [Kaistia dalseonensis]|uniref:Cystathionine beta-lyase n=1 Tax=Kaistia dalseonensis TaxID=410840 RepID=A0ABU0H1N6_9HYPH|nr:cystathionine beta-lyase [Kaistia dalseonensis]MCX5493662.1 cystathionine beta-lyase [Kaistia dalseonensis]MDQ0436224.1 cystathionine beta-lyase [Kaistia dalseonensis]